MEKAPQAGDYGCRPWLIILPIFIVFSLPFTALWAQNCPLSCVNIQISLDENCEAPVEVDLILEGDVPMSCLDDLEVVVVDGDNQPIPTSPVITGDYINQTLKGIIYYQGINSCHGNIAVEDKLAPTIHCEDVTVSCFDGTSPDEVGYPTYQDNCTAMPTLTYTDNITNFNCIDTDTTRIINRLWTVKDASNNSNTCIQKIYRVRPHLSGLSFPLDMDDEESAPLYCPDSNTHPDITGEPHFEGHPVDSACSFVANYADVVVPTCEGSFTVFREWEVFDGCHSTSMTHTQIIQVVDATAPSLECPDDVTVNTSNLDCNATVVLPQPATEDLCGSTIAITLEGTFGLIEGTTIYNLPHGHYDATCKATDDCGNIASCLFTIDVVDQVPPVAVTVSAPNVTLLPQEPTYLNAETFDDGSWDNCSNSTLTVRRMDNEDCLDDDGTEFDTIVPFYCCDVGTMVDIELRVMDEDGNFSTSITTAQITDNLNPGILCPPTATIDCDDNYHDLDLTGHPTATDNCPGFVVTQIDSVNINSCGDGIVLRSFTVEDAVGRTASCTQTIQLENQNPFYINETDPNDPNDDVIWPGNYSSITCGDGIEPENLPAGFDFPDILLDSSCMMIAMTYDDTNLGGYCGGTLREWLIIDWCQFNPITQEGLWSYIQVLQVDDQTPPNILSPCQDTTFCSYESECNGLAVTLPFVTEDDCHDGNVHEFGYSLDLFSDGTNDISNFGNLQNEELPIGTHFIQYYSVDNCENANNSCQYYITIEDCKVPTPFCEGMIVEMMDIPIPSVELFAMDFDAGSFDNCTPDAELLFSFSPDSLMESRVFTCADIGSNNLEIYVIDEAGNQDFCVVTLQLQNNNGACQGLATISGGILTADAVPVMDVQVNINGTADSTLTDAQGQYSFQDLSTGNDFTLLPHLDDQLLQGVTTFDLVLITKHILGVTPLDSPYKIIAADVNNSTSVTTLDMVFLQRAILLLDDHFPNNQSYRFVDKNYEFLDPANPLLEPFPEAISINNLTGNEQADFIAIKIGNVN